MSTVILAEKPSQAQAYASAFSTKKKDGYIEILNDSIFPNGTKITWGVGHLVELKEPSQYKSEWKQWSLDHLPIVPESFEFQPTTKTKDQYNIVKRLLDEATKIIIATDCDREGENIARSIIEVSGNDHKPMKRLWINSLEKHEVINGFKNLQDAGSYQPLYQEAQARQIGDWMVGMTGTRLYSVLLQQQGLKKKGAWSVGRVQTPTLKLIYDRQKSIENFKSEPFFEIEGAFDTDKGRYQGKVKGRYKSNVDAQLHLQEANVSEKQQTKGYISSIEKNEKRNKPPKLHSLSSLQTLANQKFKYSPSETLKIVQSLYDNPLKLVSYPRTDTQHITDNEFTYLKEKMKRYQSIVDFSFEPETTDPQKRYVDASKVQEHYAIIPTKKIPDYHTLQKLDEKQINIYMEIIKKMLGMFCSDYIYDETLMTTNVNGIDFISKGKTEVHKGWKQIHQDNGQEDNENNEHQSLPILEKGTEVKADVTIKEGKTKPPKPYTQGQLITLMKTCGKNIDDEEAQETLKEVEGLGTEATRSSIIEALMKQGYIEVKKNKVSVTEEGNVLCQSVEGTLLSKPEMTAKWEQFLKRIGQEEAEKHDFIENTKKFVNKLVHQAQEDLQNVNTEYAKKAIEDQGSMAVCPSCQIGNIMDRKKFYGCSEYRNGCKQTFPKKFVGKTITKTQVKALCEKGITSVIKGFESKKGNTFDAHLILTDEGLQMEFPKKKMKT
ncbi:DNA topoisomerase-3 [Geomicrobium halophilum]|uniref:DNA topoisomerase n=1 Tax=Geomicrobium halophilum TaxID=549000 RepID=A0A841Q1H6_9BACL|nr:type IA DNA topoisomerase [Geomicrobium halophilum]MBB6449738.1 DNA topoisomerase-3 [Geomicrobium halophilum]